MSHVGGYFLSWYLWEPLQLVCQVQHLSDWLSYTLGGELVDRMPGEAIRLSRQLFLDVLWVRYIHKGAQEGEQLAEKLLEQAQMQNFRRYGNGDEPIFESASSRVNFRAYVRMCCSINC